MIPFLVSHVLANGFDPSGALTVLGSTNVVLALVYKLPPVQPKKAVGSIAIANTRISGIVGGSTSLPAERKIRIRQATVDDPELSPRPQLASIA